MHPTKEVKKKILIYFSTIFPVVSIFHFSYILADSFSLFIKIAPILYIKKCG